MRRVFLVVVAVAAAAGLAATWGLGWAGRPGRPVRVSHVISQWTGSPGDLASLVRGSNIIVVGSVSRVVREDPVPLSAPDPATADHCTVWEIGVEQYLKSDGLPNQPPTLKLFTYGGQVEGTMQVRDGIPRLSLGSRHLLFLNTRPETRDGPNGESIAMGSGATGIESYADEYPTTDHLFSRILLKNGVTSLPEDPDQPDLQPWTFDDDGTTLLGLPEGDAIMRVQAAIPPPDAGP
jgi:hypothetical protein